VLRIGSPLLLAQSFLSDVVADYLARFPEVHVELVVADRPFDVLEESLDVAIHVLGPMDAQLVARKLGIGGRVCVASAAFVQKHGQPTVPTDLVNYPCLVNGLSRNVTWTFERDGDVHPVSVVARYAVTSMELVYRAMLADLGFAVLPAFLCAAEIQNGNLVRVLEDWSAGENTIHLIYPSHRHLAARVRAFVDLVIERLPEFPSHHLEMTSHVPRSARGDR
jgi:DNA-binding transcriptional LysR family regulator